MRTVSIETARAKLGELVALAQLAGETTVITRYGKPAAVLVPVDGILRSYGPGAASDGPEEP